MLVKMEPKKSLFHILTHHYIPHYFHNLSILVEIKEGDEYNGKLPWNEPEFWDDFTLHLSDVSTACPRSKFAKVMGYILKRKVF